MRTDGRTDGQTADISKLIVGFRNFANAPKKGIIRKSKTYYVSSKCPALCSATRSFQDWNDLLLQIPHSVVTPRIGYPVTRHHDRGGLLAHYCYFL